MQASNYIKTNINLSFISSLSYLRADYHKTSDYSYPRVAAIRIDVHPAGENSTNMPHGSHAQSAYGPRPYVSHMVYI
jgi:hypothetical protein